MTLHVHRRRVSLLLVLTGLLTPVTLASSYQHHGEKGQSIRGVEDYEQDWGRVFRLVVISGVATLASMGNIFTISAIIVDDLLRKKGEGFTRSFLCERLILFIT